MERKLPAQRNQKQQINPPLPRKQKIHRRNDKKKTTLIRGGLLISCFAIRHPFFKILFTTRTDDTSLAVDVNTSTFHT